MVAYLAAAGVDALDEGAVLSVAAFAPKPTGDTAYPLAGPTDDEHWQRAFEPQRDLA